MSYVKVIDLWPVETDCWACGKHLIGNEFSIPIYEDLVLPNSWQGEWGGVEACPSCFDLQQTLTVPMTVKAFLERKTCKQGSTDSPRCSSSPPSSS